MDNRNAVRYGDPYGVVLSDILSIFDYSGINRNTFSELWDYKFPYLKDQSDELGEKLLSLIS